MKILCEKNELMKAINDVSRAVPNKASIPALEGILIESLQDEIRLTAYDTMIGIYTSIPARVSEEGVCDIPARFLSDLVRRLPDGMVSIECGERQNIAISCGEIDFKVVGYQPEEFPELERFEEINRISVPENILKSMIGQTIFAVAATETRPIYTGILFEIRDGELNLVAVDGYRLAKRSQKTEGQYGEDCSFVIPGTTLSGVEKICSADQEEPVVISLGEKHASFSIGKTVILTRMLEGEFMNYRKSVPQSFRYELLVDREEMMQVVDRQALAIRDKQNSPIIMIINDGSMDFYCNTSFARAVDRCFCEGNGEGLKIGFNDRYLLDALKAAEGDKIRLSLNSPSNPMIIQAAENSNYLYMVLPVRLRESD